MAQCSAAEDLKNKSKHLSSLTDSEQEGGLGHGLAATSVPGLSLGLVRSDWGYSHLSEAGGYISRVLAGTVSWLSTSSRRCHSSPYRRLTALP